jgi:pyruvyl transferase EpsO
MCFTDKIAELRDCIRETLIPIIDNDFVLFDLPYHRNIGDNLIWEGEMRFLKEVGNYRLLYLCNHTTYYYHKIDKHVIILLHGGGNFGDVWHEVHKFKEKIITLYPDNKIIIFPQTVWYTDKDKLLHDINIYSAHKKLILCARDRKSYDFLKEHFTKNTVLLAPDMAFCIPPEHLRGYLSKQADKNLFLKRGDKELNTSRSNHIDKEHFDISDWPVMEKKTVYVYVLWCFLWLSRRIHVLFPQITDLYASFLFRPNMIRTGVKFISKYHKIYTTRLHGAILCCLLGKPFVLFNNSYGKNRSFFETWFKDLDGAEFH